MTTTHANDNSPLSYLRQLSPIVSLARNPRRDGKRLQRLGSVKFATHRSDDGLSILACREGLSRQAARSWPSCLGKHGRRCGELALTDFPGLKRKRNKDGTSREYWAARADLVARGFRPSSIRLHYPDTPD